MNKPKLLILITLGIITFFSCKLNYEDTKKKVASYKEVTYDELIPQKDTKKQKRQRSTKDLKILKNNKSITQKLSEILEREMAIIKRDKLQTEIPSQFGLKNNMFELINVYKTNPQNGAKLKEKMNSNLRESQRLRRQFYSSLSYNTTDIFNLAEIVKKLYQNPKAHEIIKNISGGIRIQQRFEVALEDLAINMDRLKETALEEIYALVVDLIEIKKEWLNTIETLIKSSNATLELQYNIEKLKDHIQKLHKEKMLALCFKSEQAFIQLETLFKSNN
ncbi:complement regulator-acquiring protein [Borreliella garinii]|uniref:complement regulator-acquiring protein n=1 Tax=Borreliella garinii TaxID=29519 RepID=UPI00292DF190|nr:complement regulator-acquiring protein [Borreliella garinii]WNZ74148.1 complement regulator-acquiring protein [Borreliella garinii]WNZ75116.1 complement regulator-acquiring protein [Borreliella garinii]